MRSKLLSDLIEIGAGSIRRMDCLISLTLTSLPELEVLKERILEAQKLYPVTAGFPIKIETHDSLEDFAKTPLLHKTLLEVAIIKENTIALKMSHYLGDALSMLLFLEVLLTGQGIEGEISYRTLPSKKDSPYRNLLPVKGWMNHLPITDERQFITLHLHHSQLPEAFVLNDILSLALLRSLPSKTKALWIPVNVRKVFWQGFGNGLSRMRLYPSRQKLSTKDELKFIRRQKLESFHNGEIALPPKDFKINKQLFKLWLNRPWADWGTISFSHLDDRLGRFNGIQAVYGITNLHEKHHAGIFAFTKNDETYVTLTFDKTVASVEAKKLLNGFHTEFKALLDELNT